MSLTEHPGLTGGADPADRAGWGEHPPRMGFFTDTSVCIGCKACEVACKEWNNLPADNIGLTGESYDNTGALMRTEFGTVVVQDDVCNGCGYCVPACPFGVIGRREDDGGAHKCTLCYDRLDAGMEPACAKACPTESIQFGPLDELRERARLRVDDLHAAGQDQARLYLDDPADGIGGGGAATWAPRRSSSGCRRSSARATAPAPNPARISGG